MAKRCRYVRVEKAATPTFGVASMCAPAADIHVAVYARGRNEVIVERRMSR
jgi:hypothetical protein